MEKRKNIIISEGERPFWHLLIASVHYTAIFSLLGFWIIKSIFNFDTISLITSMRLLEIIIYILPSAILFSVIYELQFNLNTKQYKKAYSIGPIKWGKWIDLPDIEYVSVFKQPLKDGEHRFEANLWYNRNKHFNIYNSPNKPAAMEMGITVGKALNVRVLDATIANNHKWLSDNSKEN